MKNILILLLLVFSVSFLNAQNPFIGTWKSQNGNEVFYVTFYNDFGTNEIRGNYKLVIVNSSNIEIEEVYRSNKLIDGINEWPSCLLLDYNSSLQRLKGNITDNTIDFSLYNPNRSFKSGDLTVKLLNGCMGCPLTAEWKIKEPQGIKIEGEPDYNIPTDIILTKVN